MNPGFKGQLIKVKKLNSVKMRNYLEKLSHNIPIGIRLIYGRSELNCSKKLEAIKLLNEFQHEINKMKISKEIFSTDNGIENFSEYVKRIANKSDRLVEQELFFCIDDAFDDIV